MKVKINAFDAEENERIGNLINDLYLHLGTRHSLENVNLRHLVIDEGVKIEGLMSRILGFLIGIKDVTSSRSLGYKSTTLSYYAKSQLIQDVIRPYHKYQADKIELFSQIRNKFAHADIVTNMETLNTINPQIIKDLSKMYKTVEGLDQKLIALISNVYRSLLEIVINEFFIRAKHQRGKERAEYMYSQISKIIKELPNSKQLFNYLIDEFNNWNSKQIDELEMLEE